MHRTRLICRLVVFLGLAPLGAAAQENVPAAGDEARVQRLEIGVVIKAARGPCGKMLAIMPVPTEWPEQQVQIVGREVSPEVRSVRFRELDGGARQMLVLVNSLPAGRTAEALVTFEVRKQPRAAPADVASLRLPTQLDAALRRYLFPSPGIESRDTQIRALADKLTGEISTAQADTDAWRRVERIYDWVRANVRYENGAFKGALAALRDGSGDCEELTSLFIAICRASQIPARTVWVPGHCYPEFYLQGANGEGRWFPCQAAGGRQFGHMDEARPILQKGDSFRVPEKQEAQRYAAETFVEYTRGGPKAEVQFIRRPAAGSDE